MRSHSLHFMQFFEFRVVAHIAFMSFNRTILSSISLPDSKRGSTTAPAPPAQLHPPTKQIKACFTGCLIIPSSSHAALQEVQQLHDFCRESSPRWRMVSHQPVCLKPNIHQTSPTWNACWEECVRRRQGTAAFGWFPPRAGCCLCVFRLRPQHHHHDLLRMATTRAIHLKAICMLFFVVILLVSPRLARADDGSLRWTATAI